MNIIEASKQAIEKGIGITRTSFHNQMVLVPTKKNTFMLIIDGRVAIAPYHDYPASWNPQYEDIIAEDWKAVPYFILKA